MSHCEAEGSFFRLRGLLTHAPPCCLCTPEEVLFMVTIYSVADSLQASAGKSHPLGGACAGCWRGYLLIWRADVAGAWSLLLPFSSEEEKSSFTQE